MRIKKVDMPKWTKERKRAFSEKFNVTVTKKKTKNTNQIWFIRFE